jgi:hypothetical protein
MTLDALSRQIVAAKIGSRITSDPLEMLAAMTHGQDVQFLNRAHLRFMAAAGLGAHWQALAHAPTLFVLDEESVPQPPPERREIYEVLSAPWDSAPDGSVLTLYDVAVTMRAHGYSRAEVAAWLACE